MEQCDPNGLADSDGKDPGSESLATTLAESGKECTSDVGVGANATVEDSNWFDDWTEDFMNGEWDNVVTPGRRLQE